MDATAYAARGRTRPSGYRQISAGAASDSEWEAQQHILAARFVEPVVIMAGDASTIRSRSLLCRWHENRSIARKDHIDAINVSVPTPPPNKESHGLGLKKSSQFRRRSHRNTCGELRSRTIEQVSKPLGSPTQARSTYA